MTNFFRHSADDDSSSQEEQQPTQPLYTEPYGMAEYPPPPAYAPSAHHGRRAKGPVGLLAAVALAAAVVGGGTAAFVEHAADNNGDGAGAGIISGTTVSQSSKGTVAGVAQALSPTVVEITATSNSGTSQGSGVIITSNGEIVTNNHVIAGSQQISVKAGDGKTYTAQVVGADPGKDLALIKLQGASGLKTAGFADSNQLQVGDPVVAIGSPEGLTGTVTSGIVSALNRDVTVPKEEGQGQDQGGEQGQEQQGGGDNWPFQFGGQQFNGDTGSSTTTYKAIQTDAAINPGNSGGALLNLDGQVVGLNSANASAQSSDGGDSGSGGSVGLGFAIPSNTIKADLANLRDGGSN